MVVFNPFDTMNPASQLNPKIMELNMWNPLDGLSTVKVGFKRLHPDGVIPTYGSEEAAGADLYAIEKVLIKAGTQSHPIKTGIAIQLPRGFEAQIRPRSGLAKKYGLTVLNSPGTIDSDYRGEVMVMIHNTGQEDYLVRPGDRIAQMVVVPVFRAVFEVLPHLDDTIRGSDGHGSTGL